MARAVPAPLGAGSGLLLALLGACWPCAAVRLATRSEGPWEEVPPVLAAMPGYRRPPGSPAAVAVYHGFGGRPEGIVVSALQIVEGDGGSGSLSANTAKPAPQNGTEQQSEVTLHVLSDPWWAGNKDIHLVTVETRPNKTTVPGMINAGLNGHWEGYITKVELLLKWLNEHRNDKAQIIFVDGEDTMFGGCTQEQFLHDYWEIVNRSGGVKLVTGAERGCFECPEPWHCDTVPEVPEWAYRNWSLADGGLRIPASKLDPSGQMRFPNSGFLTGPADELRALLRATLYSMRHEEGRVRGDQYYLTKHVLEHPNTVAIDYASSLVTCGYALKVSKLFKLLPGGGLYNQVTEKQQCFFHANGPSIFTSRGIAKWQRGGRKPW